MARATILTTLSETLFSSSSPLGLHSLKAFRLFKGCIRPCYTSTSSWQDKRLNLMTVCKYCNFNARGNIVTRHFNRSVQSWILSKESAVVTRNYHGSMNQVFCSADNNFKKENFCIWRPNLRKSFKMQINLLSFANLPSTITVSLKKLSVIRSFHLDRSSLCKEKPHGASKYKEQRENVLTVPNFLSGLRILLSPLIGFLAISNQYSAALGFLGVAAATDLLDGYIARQFHSQKSVFGSILDPAADKILMTVLVISLSVANLIPVPLCLLIVGRDVGLVAGVSYLRFKTLPAPRTINRYFDVNHPTVQLHPTFISKVNTFLQVGLLGAALAAPLFQMSDSLLLKGYMYLVASTTVISAFSYVFSKDTFKILKSLPK